MTNHRFEIVRVYFLGEPPDMEILETFPFNGGHYGKTRGVALIDACTIFDYTLAEEREKRMVKEIDPEAHIEIDGIVQTEKMFPDNMDFFILVERHD